MKTKYIFYKKLRKNVGEKKNIDMCSKTSAKKKMTTSLKIY